MERISPPGSVLDFGCGDGMYLRNFCDQAERLVGIDISGPMIEMAAVVDLAPGESMEYAASFVPVVCAVEDDLAESFRDDLPPAPAGSYDVSALIDLSTDGNAELISGPSSTITVG